MKTQLARLGAVAGAVALGIASFASVASSQNPPPQTRAYVPAVFSSPPSPTPSPTVTPSPTPSVPAGCLSTTGQSYGQLPIVGPPTNIPAAQDPDLNLDIRGWATAPGNPPLSLVSYTGSPDPSAPQLAALFSPNRLPTFSSAYEVYNWNWSTNSRGSLMNNWPVTLLGMSTQTGEEISVPTSGYSIGQGYEVLVLYATQQQITLTFTGNDSIVNGYSLHVENVCVDQNLLNLYNNLNAAGRSQLPALKAGQPFGFSNGTEIQVAIRDTGEFMDPRSQTDWWQGY